MIARLTTIEPRRLALFGWALITTLLLGGWLHLVWPAVRDYRKLATESDTLRATLRSEDVEVGDTAQVTKEIDALTAKLEAAKHVTSITHVMSHLRGAATESGVTLGAVAPAKEAASGRFDPVSFDVEARGGYPELAAFVSAFEARIATLAVTSLRFTRAPDTDLLLLKLRVTGYRPLASVEEKK